MPVDNLRELCLWPTDGRRGWKRHCLQSNTYLALEIARTGSASACMWACVKEQPARERKQKPLIKITPRRWPLTPILKKCVSTFSLSLSHPVWSLVCAVDPASLGSRCNPPEPPLPCQAHSPLHVSFTLLPPHLSALSLCTGSNFTHIHKCVYVC